MRAQNTDSRACAQASGVSNAAEPASSKCCLFGKTRVCSISNPSPSIRIYVVEQNEQSDLIQEDKQYHKLKELIGNKLKGIRESIFYLESDDPEVVIRKMIEWIKNGICCDYDLIGGSESYHNGSAIDSYAHSTPQPVGLFSVCTSSQYKRLKEDLSEDEMKNISLQKIEDSKDVLLLRNIGAENDKISFVRV